MEFASLFSSSGDQQLLPLSAASTPARSLVRSLHDSFVGWQSWILSVDPKKIAMTKGGNGRGALGVPVAVPHCTGPSECSADGEANYRDRRRADQKPFVCMGVVQMESAGFPTRIQ